MKPDWKDAPDWAEWLHWHEGRWWWTALKPDEDRFVPQDEIAEHYLKRKLKMEAVTSHMRWQQSVEPRPEAK